MRLWLAGIFPAFTIRRFIRQWSDSKLKAVAAFNRSGGMVYWSTRRCLVAVHGSDQLPAPNSCAYRANNDRLRHIDNAYFRLGGSARDDYRRDEALQSILDSELNRRHLCD